MDYVQYVLVQMLLLVNIDVVQGKYIHGYLSTNVNFKFIDRFCFQPNEVGQMTFEFKYEADECCYTLLMFNDEPFQWPFVRKHGASMTCGELKELIPGSYNAKMTLTDPFNGCTRTNNHTDGIEYMKCKGTRNFVTVRERWWYIVMSHCYYDTGLHIEYKITMTNGNKIWDRHFSADERYIFETDFTFLFLYLFALIVTLYYIKILKERRLLHSTYKMFVFSMVFENISLFFMNIQLGTYAQDGVGLPKLKVLANLLSTSSLLVFISVIILLGKGYTITRGTISQSGAIKITIYMSLFTFTYGILYIYEESVFDERDVLYKYESPAGYGIVALHFIGYIWMLYAILITIKRYPEKTTFYFKYSLIFTTWWLATPIAIFICNFSLDKWIRAKIVNGIERSVIFGGHIFFLILTRPSAANKNFPFHLRTTQVDAMQLQEACPESYFGTPRQFSAGNGTTPINNISFNDLFVTDWSSSQQENQVDNSNVESNVYADPKPWVEDFEVEKTVDV